MLITFIIDGNGHIINAQGKTRIFRTGKNITIKNITLQNGYTEYFGGGGAIKNMGELTIQDTTLTQNKATNSGGAINNEEGKLNLQNSILNNNITIDKGGAIYNNYGEVIINNSTLNYNTAAKRGGAINNDCGGMLTIKNTYFDNNNAEEEYTKDIYNDGKLTLIEPKFNNTTKTIQNHKTICFNKKIEQKIQTEGYVSLPLKENEKNFKYMDQLIHNKSKMIKLENDIKLDSYIGEGNEFGGVKMCGYFHIILVNCISLIPSL